MTHDETRAAPFEPLPSEPGFCVYGLSDEFTGPRWIALWNPPEGELGEVDLGHGNLSLEVGPSVVVLTCAKRSGHEDNTETIEHAAARALLYLYHAAESIDGINRASVVEWIGRLSRQRDDAPWQQTAAVVDGAVREATLYERDGYWAAVLDLDAAAVGVFGSRTKLSDCEFTRINGSLERYSASQ